MSIKSDRWIRRMAVHGMIEPFEPQQVRVAPDGHQIVSYGTSSYGYDIRCAHDFKFFTDRTRHRLHSRLRSVRESADTAALV